MFLEYWQIGTLGAVFALGLWHTGKQGLKDGVELGTNLTLHILDQNGIIKVTGEQIEPGEKKSPSGEKNRLQNMTDVV